MADQQSVVEGMYELTIEASVLAQLVWLTTAIGAGRLATRTTEQRIVWRARTGVLGLGAGLASVGLEIYAIWSLSRHGLSLAADFALVALPLLVLPATMVVAMAVHRYVQLARSPAGSHRQLQIIAAEPRLVVPVQLTAFGALLNLIVILSPPAEPYLPWTMLWLNVLAFTGWALAIRRRALARRVANPGYIRPLWWRRWIFATTRVLALVALLALASGIAAWDSRLPDQMSMAEHVDPESAGTVPVTQFTTTPGAPTRTITLVARSTRFRLGSGEFVDGLSFNGTLPGPTLRLRVGEFVEVRLINVDVAAGVSVHWHGLDVPNAVDGVPGVTQDAVPPGGTYTYLLRPQQAGTFWYHSHQDTPNQVFRGLFGALVVDPPTGPKPGVVDTVVVAHAWNIGGRARTTLGDRTDATRRVVPTGSTVRLRLVNADNCPRTYALAGAAYRLVAIDGVSVHGPTPVVSQQLRLAGGGRYDVEYVQPAGTVQLTVPGDANGLPAGFGVNEGCGEDNAYGGAAQGRDARTDRQARTALALVTGPNPSDPVRPVAMGELLDPLHYGTPAPTPFNANSRFQVTAELRLGLSFGFYDGHFTGKWTINNASYPNVPPIVVDRDDLVRVTFVNRSLDDHPMHPHGHHMLVLSRNGVASTGSPWWVDTLDVAPGDRYDVAFRADNPGIWMDHCHNLEHTRVGMMMHLVYRGVTTPYLVGRRTPNDPE